MNVKCPNARCGRPFAAPVAAGRTVRCPACQGAISVSGTDPQANPTDAYTDPLQASPSPPAVIGRFVVRNQLGAGAFGVVYRAFDPQLQREVALKVPNAGVLDSPLRVERFLREARAAANLAHPHIVSLFDAGKDGGQYFIASAFVDGRTLATSIPEGGTGIRRAVRLSRELAKALAYAHDQGIVHRDVKPANCLLDAKDRLHLADFGLAARADGSEAKLTTDGAVLGTPAYMAPEQAAGRTADPRPESDQYAAGVVLYELLTGRTPFAGPPSVVIYNLLNTDPERPARVRPGIPADLEAICLKAMDRGFTRRYRSCRELADDLARWEAGRPVTARRVGPVGRSAKWARRNPVVAGLVAAVAVTLGMGIGISTYFAVSANARADAEARARRMATDEQARATEQAQIARAERTRAQELAREARGERSRAKVQTQVAEGQAKLAAEHRERAEYELRRANTALYAGDLERAEAALNRNDARTARQYLDQCEPEYCDWEHDYLWGRLGRQTFHGHTEGVTSVCVTRDGRRLVSGSWDKTAKIWDAETGTEVQTLVGHSEGVTSVCVSPHGAWIATASRDNTAKVWDAETGNELRTLAGHEDCVTCVRVSPDGRRIVTASMDTTAKVWDATTGEEVRTLAGHTGAVTCICYSPDGRRIVTASQDKTAKVWDADTGRERLALIGHTADITCVCVSPDGRRIVTASMDRTVKLWDARTGDEIHTLVKQVFPVSCLCISPDGRQIAVGGQHGSVTIWDSETGRGVHTFVGHSGGVTGVCVSPDGRRIVTASTDKTAKVWDAEARAASWTLGKHADEVVGVCVSPDGRRIVTASTDKTAKVWDADTGRERLTLAGHTGSVTGVCVSPDGRRIVTASQDKTAKVWDADTGRERLTLAGHADCVTSVWMSPDGRRIVTGSWDRTAKVWDAETGTEVQTLAGHGSIITSVTGSPDGRRIVTGSWDRTAKVWDAETGTEVQTLAGHEGWVLCVCVSPDGRRIVTASQDKTAKVWDADTGRERLTLAGHTSEIPSVCISPNGRRIVTVGWDSRAKVWDVATGRELITLVGDPGLNDGVCVSPDGRRIVAGSLNNAIVWSAETGRELRVLAGTSRTPLAGIDASPDGRQVYAWDVRGRILGRDLASGRPIDPTGQIERSTQMSDRTSDGRYRIVALNEAVGVVDLQRVGWPFPDAGNRAWYHDREAGRSGPFAAAFHLSRAELARSDLALAAGDIQAAFWHKVSARILHENLSDRIAPARIDRSDRAKWVHGAGYFELVAPMQWKEVRPDGSTAEFTEVDRTTEYVELYDRSRDVGIRLYESHAPLRQPATEDEYRPFFKAGKWVPSASGSSPGPASR